MRTVIHLQLLGDKVFSAHLRLTAAFPANEVSQPLPLNCVRLPQLGGEAAASGLRTWEHLQAEDSKTGIWDPDHPCSA